ncbi:hypothetical protein RR48_07278, partial [Papilio machaon]
GSTDVDMPSSLLHTIQNQMQSKGGYEMAYGVKKPTIKGENSEKDHFVNHKAMLNVK